MKVIWHAIKVCLTGYLIFGGWFMMSMVSPGAKLQEAFLFATLCALLWKGADVLRYPFWRGSFVVGMYMFSAGLCWGISLSLPY
jgi:hypothetical protein